MRKFQEEVLANETKHHLVQLKNRNLELLLQRAQEEIKLYVSSKTEDKKKSLREQLLKQVLKKSSNPNLTARESNYFQIADQEKRSKVLKEEQKKVKDSLSVASKQVGVLYLCCCKKNMFFSSKKKKASLLVFFFFSLGEIME